VLLNISSNDASLHVVCLYLDSVCHR